MSIFTVEIMRPGNFGLNTSATLEMPATWAEYQDVKEKARITDDRVIYSYNLLRCEHDWLRPHIPENANLLELNLLAARMEHYIKDDLDVFEAMVKVETGRNNGEPLPVQKLINMTFSTDNCHVVGDITSDARLGKFLFDNEFFTDEDVGAVQARIDSGRPVSALLTALGKEHRETNGGVLTASGRYVEYDGSLNEIYVPGEMVYFDRSGAPVVLEISKGFFDDPDYDNDLTATLDLPPYTQKKFDDALEKVQVSSIKECGYRCTDCLIPAAKEWIDDAQDLDQAYNFAIALDRMERHGGVVEYKALLEAAECGDLNTALRMTDGIDEYQLMTECSGPEDYARDYMDRHKVDKNIDLSEFYNLYALGQKVMEHENAANTSYGVLKRKDGGPILSQTDAPGMNMTMGGMNG